MAIPKVSIIIPVYNGADYLAQAIDSALAQTWRNLEVIVVNDGSNDDGATERIAQSYGNRIRYISKQNGGVASALNTGIASMTGEYFSWLSHDDLYLPNKIKHQMRLLKRLKDPYQIVAGGYYIVNADMQLLGVMDFHRLYGQEKLRRPLFPVFHCAVNGCTLLIHKSHFDRVGCFREDLPTTQDYDLWFRLLKGNSLIYSHRIDVISRTHAAQTSQRNLQTHERECTVLWLDLLNRISDQEKIDMTGSLEAFYVDLFQHFTQRTSYREVADYLRHRCPQGTGMQPFPCTQPLKPRWYDSRRIRKPTLAIKAEK